MIVHWSFQPHVPRSKQNPNPRLVRQPGAEKPTRAPNCPENPVVFLARPWGPQIPWRVFPRHPLIRLRPYGPRSRGEEVIRLGDTGLWAAACRQVRGHQLSGATRCQGPPGSGAVVASSNAPDLLLQSHAPLGLPSEEEGAIAALNRQAMYQVWVGLGGQRPSPAQGRRLITPADDRIGQWGPIPPGIGEVLGCDPNPIHDLTVYVPDPRQSREGWRVGGPCARGCGPRAS